MKKHIFACMLVLFVGVGGHSQSPALAVGLKKIVSGYSGPAMRIQRLSDNTQTDINFVASGAVDTSAILTFLGSTSTVGYVVKLYDQSGNGYDVTQTTVANAPTIMLSAPTTMTISGNTFTTARSIITSTSNEAPVAGPGYWNLPSGFTTNLQGTSVVLAYSPDYSGGEGFEEYGLGTTTANNFDLIREYNGLYGVVYSSSNVALYFQQGYFTRQQPTVVTTTTSSGGAALLYADGSQFTGGGFGSASAATLTGGTLLTGTYKGVSAGTFQNFLAFEVFNTTLTPTQVATVSSAIIPRSVPNYNLVGDGDSITEGHCATYGRAALRYAEPSLNSPTDITNLALGGTTTSNPLSNVSSPSTTGSFVGRLYNASYTNNIYYLAIGTNDIHVNNATGAATWSNVQTILADAKAIGYKTALATIMHESGETTAQGNEVNNFNALARAASTSYVDVLIDYAATSTLNPANYSGNFCDGTHPNDSGYAIMGGVAATALNTLIAGTSTTSTGTMQFTGVATGTFQMH